MVPGVDLDLDTEVRYVKGVGPVRAEQLGKLGIRTAEDLLLYFPRRLDLRRQCQPIAALTGQEQAATVAGEVLKVKELRFGKHPYFQASSGQRVDDSAGPRRSDTSRALVVKNEPQSTGSALHGPVGVFYRSDSTDL